MSKISELSDGGSLVSSDYLIAVRSGGNVKVRMDQINVDQVDLGDNEFIRLGNSQDLTMVHTATQSIINQAGIGDLLIQKAGATKLTINATGIDVTGSVTADGLTVDGSSTFDDILLTAVALPSAGNPSIALRNTDNNIYIQAGSGNAITFLDSSQNTMLSATPTSHSLQISNGNAFAIDSNRDISFYEDTGTTPKFFWDASAESLGIGTSLPDTLAHLAAGAGSAVLRLENTDAFLSDGEVVGKIEFETQDSGGAGVNAYIQGVGVSTNGATKLEFGTGGSNSPETRMTINSNGYVGIGTDSPSALLHLKATGGSVIQQFETTGGTVARTWKNFVSSGTGAYHIQDATASANRVIIDTSGRVLIGHSTAKGYALDVDKANLGAASFNRTGTDGEVVSIRKDGTTVGSIGVDSGDNLYIGGSAASHSGLYFGTHTAAPITAGTLTDAVTDLGTAGYRFKDLHLSGTANASYGTFLSGVASESIQLTLGYSAGNMWTLGRENAVTGDLLFKNNGTSEKMRLTAAGNLLVGKTSTSFSTAGSRLTPDGGGQFIVSGGAGVEINRLSSDGTLLGLYKDGATVGSIGAELGNVSLNSASTGFLSTAGTVRYKWDNLQFYPAVNNNNNLGTTNFKWKDLYLSGGVVFGDAGGSGSSSSNTLDSYEEGTWTPANAGNLVINSIQNARYTKVGDIVTATAWLKANPSSTTFIISGLPFSSAGRSAASLSDVSNAITISNQIVGTQIYGYGGSTSGTNNDFFISATYHV